MKYTGFDPLVLRSTQPTNRLVLQRRSCYEPAQSSNPLSLRPTRAMKQLMLRPTRASTNPAYEPTRAPIHSAYDQLILVPNYPSTHSSSSSIQTTKKLTRGPPFLFFKGTFHGVTDLFILRTTHLSTENSFVYGELTFLQSKYSLFICLLA